MCAVVKATSHLVLFEVTQGLDDDCAAALLLRVARLQPDDGLGFVDQTLDLSFVFHDSLLLFLQKRNKTSLLTSVGGSPSDS